MTVGNGWLRNGRRKGRTKDTVEERVEVSFYHELQVTRYMTHTSLNKRC